MPGKWPQQELPNLTDNNHRITSADTNRYNCIAWAAGEDFRNWWPDRFGVGFWPSSAPREETMAAFIAAYESRGFRLCVGGNFEPSQEKIAIFGVVSSPGKHIPTHAARQLETGEWTSKLGRFEDIVHATAEAVNGPVYGQVVFYMSRSRPSS